MNRGFAGGCNLAAREARGEYLIFLNDDTQVEGGWLEALIQAADEQPLAGAVGSRVLNRDGGTMLARFRASGQPMRVLLIDDRILDAALGSGFSRVHQMVCELAAAHVWVSIYPTATAEVSDRRVLKAIDVITGDLVEHLRGPSMYEVIVVSCPHNFEQYAPMVRRHQPRAALVYDAEALFHRRIERQVHFATDGQERDRLRREAASLRRVEQGVRRDADLIVSVSPDEARWLTEQAGDAPVIAMLPTLAGARFTDRAFHDRNGAVLIAGWLGGVQSPNADGLRWFCQHIAPRIRDMGVSFLLRVTGTDPPRGLLELAADDVMFIMSEGQFGWLDIVDRARLDRDPARVAARFRRRFATPPRTRIES